jgi:putative tricarboxylic transport membrane protein
MELIFTICLGIISGIFAGLLPGIPIFLGFILFLPFVPVDPLMLLIYGIVMNIGTQFFGSMSALYFRVPGESSSYPILMEINNFNTPAKLHLAILLTTLGSLIATLVAALSIWLALYTGVFNQLYMPILLKMFLFSLLTIFSISANKNYIGNFLLLLCCSIFVFYPEIASNSKGTLPIYYFNNMLALIIIFAMQMIWNKTDALETANTSKKSNISIRNKIPMMLKYSMIGTLFGLIPQIGSTISSYAGYTWEKFRGRDSFSRITASETTNNSAIIFSWLPLLLFGVPITATEILLLQQLNTFGFSLNFMNSSSTQLQLLFAMIVSGMIYYVLSAMVNHNFYNKLGKVITQRWFTLSLVLLSVGMFYFLNHYSFGFIIMHILIFVPISWLIHRLKLSIITIVIGLILMKDIIFTALQSVQIYF